MLTFGLGSLLAVLTGFNPWLSDLQNPGKYFKGTLLRFVIFGPAWWAVMYFAMPSLTGPLWGLTWPLIMALAVNLIVSGVARNVRNEYGEEIKLPWGGIISWTALVILCSGIGLMSTSCLQSKTMARMIGEVQTNEWKEDLRPINTSHIIQVSLEQADWKGRQILGEGGAKLGSKFHPAGYTIQRVKDRLVYISPLDYNGFQHWSAGEVPSGYVMIDAQDPEATGHLVTSAGESSLAMRYMPLAYFGEDLHRHIYHSGYSRYNIADTVFEVDDELRPYWVIALSRPQALYACQKILGSLIVDPQSGRIDEYIGEGWELKLPAWVDRVHPANLTVDYINWWGKWSQGFWNGFWYKTGTVKATDSAGYALNMVWGSDNQPYWFSGITSTSSSDSSLVSYMMVNTITGRAVEYKAAGPDEGGVLKAVNNRVSYRNLHGANPVLYNLYGTRAWAVPLNGQNHTYQGMALVKQENSNDVAEGATLAEALTKFQQLLTSGGSAVPTADANMREVEFIVSRVQQVTESGSSLFFIFGDEVDLIFTANRTVSSKVPLTQVGDKVSVTYLDTGDPVVPVKEFDNAAIKLRERK